MMLNVPSRKVEVGLVDVRSLKEFNGEITAPPEYPMEHAQRGGHIPGQKIFLGFRPLRKTGLQVR